MALRKKIVLQKLPWQRECRPAAALSIACSIPGIRASRCTLCNALRQRWGDSFALSSRARDSSGIRSAPSRHNRAGLSQQRTIAELDTSRTHPYSGSYGSAFSPEQEAQLSRIASHTGMDTELFVKDAALRRPSCTAKKSATVSLPLSAKASRRPIGTN
jgi:hypothetical protein